MSDDRRLVISTNVRIRAVSSAGLALLVGMAVSAAAAPVPPAPVPPQQIPACHELASGKARTTCREAVRLFDRGVVLAARGQRPLAVRAYR